ncbi:MAG: hypothetical protein QOH76_1559 [Thermoleophilaceae bacterium]|jgi:uncharacterized protein (DUF488 family)|nr:hypothetical protein [Thermoleophilaceae bacterium]
MDIYSIGFTKTTAEGFFTRLIDNDVERVLDVRLNTSSQLAGFAKGRDLPYFLSALGDIAYEHEQLLCPSAEILNSYKKRRDMPWSEYEERFMALMDERRIAERLDRGSFERRTALLCSEDTAEHCHRRLVIEYLGHHWPGVRGVHL